MAIISVCNGKGGVGKTTTSLHVAEGLALKGLKVVVYDVDPQGSATFHYKRKEREWLCKVHPRKKKAMTDEIRALSKVFDIVLVDTRPDLGEDTQTIMKNSELVIITAKPGGYETKSLGQLMEILPKITKSNPKLVIRSLLCFANKRYVLFRDMEKALETSSIKPFKSKIVLSEMFNHLTRDGTLMYDKKERLAKKISREYFNLVEEIVEELVKLRK